MGCCGHGISWVWPWPATGAGMCGGEDVDAGSVVKSCGMVVEPGALSAVGFVADEVGASDRLLDCGVGRG